MTWTDSLAPTLLLAMPQMQDPNFARSVVFLCRHEKDGAMGLVVNRKTETLVSSIAVFDPPPKHDNGLEVFIGGPVEPQRGFHLCASSEVLRRAIETAAVPNPEHRFLLGYAGWGSGQLESELAASAWLTADVSKGLVFGTPPEEMWEAAIRSLGVNPYSLQLGSGVH